MDVRKYLRNPKKYAYMPYDKNEEVVYGFDGFVKELDRTIAWQEHMRSEYEIGVSGAFATDCEKWDCYQQCKPNIEMIAREVIRQYKEQRKIME